MLDGMIYVTYTFSIYWGYIENWDQMIPTARQMTR